MSYESPTLQAAEVAGFLRTLPPQLVSETIQAINTDLANLATWSRKYGYTGAPSSQGRLTLFRSDRIRFGRERFTARGAVLAVQWRLGRRWRSVRKADVPPAGSARSYSEPARAIPRWREARELALSPNAGPEAWKVCVAAVIMAQPGFASLAAMQRENPGLLPNVGRLFGPQAGTAGPPAGRTVRPAERLDGQATDATRGRPRERDDFGARMVRDRYAVQAKARSTSLPPVEAERGYGYTEEAGLQKPGAPAAVRDGAQVRSSSAPPGGRRSSR